jgi:peptide/nickel transport system substrate-binding protein
VAGEPKPRRPDGKVCDRAEYIALDVLPVLRSDRRINTPLLDPTGGYMIFRLNHLQPPFDNPRIRRALFGAVDQADYVAAVIGDPSLGQTGVGFFCPTSPMASSAGMEALTGQRDLERVRREIANAGYRGEPVVLLVGGDSGENIRRAAVLADMMHKVGLNVHQQVSDFATLVQRIFKGRAERPGVVLERAPAGFAPPGLIVGRP